MIKQQNTSDIILTLRDNGIDFILKGIDELFNDQYVLSDDKIPTQFSKTDYKYGCLHLFAGFTLLLKERLARHMPELIYEGNLKTIRERLKKPDKLPNTVNFQELIERLEIGPRITFSPPELKTIERMRSFRNTFEHGEFTGNKNHLWRVFSEFLDIVDNFLVKELDIEIEKTTESEKLRNKISKIDNAWERTKQMLSVEIQTDLKNKLQSFKNEKKEYLELIEQEGIREIREPRSVHIIECGNCFKDGLMVSGEYRGICVYCQETSPITDCLRCQEPISGYVWYQNICENCESYLADQ